MFYEIDLRSKIPDGARIARALVQTGGSVMQSEVVRIAGVVLPQFTYGQLFEEAARRVVTIPAEGGEGDIECFDESAETLVARRLAAHRAALKSHDIESVSSLLRQFWKHPAQFSKEHAYVLGERYRELVGAPVAA